MSNATCGEFTGRSACQAVFPCCVWDEDTSICGLNLYPPWLANGKAINAGDFPACYKDPWHLYQPWSSILVACFSMSLGLGPVLSCYLYMLVGRLRTSAFTAKPQELVEESPSMRSSRTSGGSPVMPPLLQRRASSIYNMPLQSVDVEQVWHDLDTAKVPVHRVMKELQEGFKYCGKYVLGRKLAIISYRVATDPADPFSLDAAAFLSAINAARSHGVECLWLDLWAYRARPPWAPYVHAHFTGTLACVMENVSLVIWLPRSRPSAAGQYQERLWCSYEAAMVEARGLEVGAALMTSDWWITPLVPPTS